MRKSIRTTFFWRFLKLRVSYVSFRVFVSVAIAELFVVVLIRLSRIFIGDLSSV